MLRIRKDAEMFVVEIQDLEMARQTGDDVWHKMKAFDNEFNAHNFAFSYGEEVLDTTEEPEEPEAEEPTPEAEEPTPASEDPVPAPRTRRSAAAAAPET